MWICGVYQGNDEGPGILDSCRGQRPTMQQRGDTRLSPHLSVVTLGCLDGRDERSDRVATKPLVDN
jgi:hypothetical protein